MQSITVHASGIRISAADQAQVAQAEAALRTRLAAQAPQLVSACVHGGQGWALQARLDDASLAALLPGFDTSTLAATLGLDTTRDEDLAREILLAMLAAPVAFEFPSLDEFFAAIRMRANIVRAARATALAFHTTEAERPEEFWQYVSGHGFTLRAGKSLIEALRVATQPEVSGRRFDFSCYRATEYVLLLGIAEELALSNPALLAALEAHWRESPIMSGLFHEVFLRESGSMEAPLPARYYVPGDRVWFRNPDERSADVTGFEGSWVIYLGSGLFSNFWDNSRPYTLNAKCMEIFHWRDGVIAAADGELAMDEDEVARRVEASLRDPAQVDAILTRMLRYREPRGVYRDGGCIDTTREFPRWVCPGTADLQLPT